MSMAGKTVAGVAVLALLAGGSALVIRNARLHRAPAPAPLAPAYSYKVDAREARSACAPRAGFARTATWPTGLGSIRALAGGPDGRFVAGDTGRVVIIEADGAIGRGWAAPEGLQCLALGSNGVWAGGGGRVWRWTLEGTPVGEPARYATNSTITAVAVSGDRLFVADAGAREVYACDLEGRVVQRIGRRDAERGIPGFVIPSPHFDLLMAPDGLLRVVNPGRHRVEAYTLAGDLELSWGTPSMAVDGFSGCCNPSYLALLPDGRYVTSEKGLRRVKVYDAGGVFAGVVVGTDELGTGSDPAPIATDVRGRILIAASGDGKVAVYEAQDRR